MENWVSKRQVYHGRIIDLYAGDARIDDGSIHPREVVTHGGGVAMAPLIDGNVILVKQYRIAVEKSILELPAGRLEGGEDPVHRAHVELEEEIGYRAGRLIHAASCYCSPGFTNELDHIFLAVDLEPVERRPEADERIEVVTIPLRDARKMLHTAEFEDAKTIIGIEALLRYIEENGRLQP